MSQITNRADIWSENKQNAPKATWEVPHFSLSEVSQSWAAGAICRPLPSTECWPFPFSQSLVLTCWISSWLMSPTPLVVSHQTVPVCSYSPTVEVMSNTVFWSQSSEKWSAFVCPWHDVCSKMVTTINSAMPWLRVTRKLMIWIDRSNWILVKSFIRRLVSFGGDGVGKPLNGWKEWSEFLNPAVVKSWDD